MIWLHVLAHLWGQGIRAKFHYPFLLSSLLDSGLLRTLRDALQGFLFLINIGGTGPLLGFNESVDITSLSFVLQSEHHTGLLRSTGCLLDVQSLIVIYLALNGPDISIE